MVDAEASGFFIDAGACAKAGSSSSRLGAAAAAEPHAFASAVRLYEERKNSFHKENFFDGVLNSKRVSVDRTKRGLSTLCPGA